MIGTPLASRSRASFSGVCPPILHDDTRRLLDGDDFEHIFKRQRFEIKTVGRIVIGRNCFRVAVDHDGLETILAQSQRGMNTAVIKLDTLSDAVRSPTQNHDFLIIAWQGFAFFFIGGIHVGRLCREFGRAGIHALVYRAEIELMAP